MSRLDELERLLTKHYSNLNKLREDAAIFGAGYVPLPLRNQIEATEAEIEKLQAEVEGLREDATGSVPTSVHKILKQRGCYVEFGKLRIVFILSVLIAVGIGVSLLAFRADSRISYFLASIYSTDTPTPPPTSTSSPMPTLTDQSSETAVVVVNPSPTKMPALIVTPQFDSSLSFGDIISNTLALPTETQLYTFRASVGDVILIRLSRSAGDLCPQVRLWGPDRSEIANKGSFPSCRTVEIEQTLALEGDYTILIGDEFSSNTGEYVLNLQKIFP